MTKPKRKRGRPPGTSGRAAVLSPNQVRHALRVARSRGRHADRAEAVLAMSVGLGLRAMELAALKWSDVYDADGRVRVIVHLRAAYTKGGKKRDVFVSSPALRRVLAKYGERDWLQSATASQTPQFASQKGGAMTPASMARFLKSLYADAGILGGGIDLKAIAEIAGHTSIRTTAMYVESNPKRLARILQDVTF
jgi:integrase/recombinase XerD